MPLLSIVSLFVELVVVSSLKCRVEYQLPDVHPPLFKIRFLVNWALVVVETTQLLQVISFHGLCKNNSTLSSPFTKNKYQRKAQTKRRKPSVYIHEI